MYLILQKFLPGLIVLVDLIQPLALNFHLILSSYGYEPIRGGMILLESRVLKPPRTLTLALFGTRPLSWHFPARLPNCSFDLSESGQHKFKWTSYFPIQLAQHNLLFHVLFNLSHFFFPLFSIISYPLTVSWYPGSPYLPWTPLPHSIPSLRLSV